MNKQIVLSLVLISGSMSAGMNISQADVMNLYTMAKMEVESRLPALKQLVMLLEQNKVSQAQDFLMQQAGTINFAPLKSMIVNNVDNAKKVIAQVVAQLPPQVADVSGMVKNQINANQVLLNDIKAKIMSLNTNDLNFAIQRARDFGASLVRLKDKYPTEYRAFVNQLKMGVQKLQENADTLKAFGQKGVNKVNDLVAYVKDVASGKESSIDLTDALAGFNALRDLLPTIFAAIKNGVDVALSINGKTVIGTVATEIGYPQAAPSVIMALEQVKDKANQAEQAISNQLTQLIGE